MGYTTREISAPVSYTHLVIAQGVSGVLCLIYIAANIPVLHLRREDFQVGSTILLSQLHVGLSLIHI